MSEKKRGEVPRQVHQVDISWGTPYNNSTTMRTCKICGLELALEQFYEKGDRGPNHPERREHKCKTCRRRRWTHRNSLYVTQAKSNPCTDCGIAFPAEIMEFDHLPAHVKLFPLNKAHHQSLKAVQDEIAKCELVCRNCHGLRTIARRNTRA